jgi:hypothetical protein
VYTRRNVLEEGEEHRRHPRRHLHLNPARAAAAAEANNKAHLFITTRLSS